MNTPSAPTTRRHLPRRRWVLLSLVAALLGLQTVLFTPAATAAGPCAKPPAIDAFNGGMTGAIDPAIARGLAGSAYRDYGYSGHVWHTYDVGDRITCTDPHASINNWVGNALFDGAKVQVAITNALHYEVHEGGLASSLDEAVRIGSDATFRGFAVPFLPIALLIVAIVLFKFVFAGKLAEVASGAGRVLIAVTFIAATATSPLLYSKLFDGVLLSGVQEIEDHMTEAIYGPDTVAREVLPTTLHNHVVYNNWLRGEFGDEKNPHAQKLGRKLLDAQAFTWQEVRTGKDGDEAVIEAKQEKFKQVAQELESTSSYSTFTGTNGDRFGTGALAFTQASLFTPLQAVAKLAYLFAQLVLRVAVLFGPILGMFMLVNGVARTVLRGVLGVAVLGLMFWAVANVHTLLLRTILDSGMSMMAELALMALITILIWAVVRPVKRLKDMTFAAMHAVPGSGMHKAVAWLRHRRVMSAMRKRGGAREKRWWEQRPEPTRQAGAGEAAEAGDEAAPDTVYAHATRPEASRATSAVGAAAALLGGRGGSRGAGAGPDAAPGAPPPPPRDPRGNDPSGHGTVFAHPGAQPYDWPRGTIRAEATRLHEADGTPYQPHGGNGATGSGLPRGDEATRQALPPGRSEAGQGENADSSAAANATDDQRDIVIPSEIEGAEHEDRKPPHIRESRPTTDDNGRPVWQLYRPSQDRVVEEPDAEKPAARPEAQPDPHRPVDDTTPAKENPDADSH